MIFEFWPSTSGTIALMRSPGVGLALTHFANDVVVPIAREYVGEQWPGGKSPGGTPPRPYRRSGELQRRIRPTPPRVDGEELAVWCITDPYNGGRFYSEILMRPELPNQGKYRFMPDEFYIGGV